MADLVLLTSRAPVDAAVPEVAPGLALLPHHVSVRPMDVGPLATGAEPDLLVVDAVSDLVAARGTLRSLAAVRVSCPVLLVVDVDGLSVVDRQWPMDDLVLCSAGPAEMSARVRLLLARGPGAATTAGGRAARPATEAAPEVIRVADVVVDEASWSVRAGGVPLDLTFKEFELLRYLVQRPGRVVTRDTLLQEVWGMDYYGGTRTVDVHVRRLRAKLGPERESLIGTIRGVGYRFSGPRTGDA
ncbi:winged helix-turn-helix transcriptional regulator [Ornithinimicrobium pekingense]|uniref:winged helix-turn-helix transcriptional regulator n=1 Tax=Ornithinimicrobium pekingense TaxID=384677 RepID=UPI000492E177|nr:response regulator transcription factor [Ornithinimicrobium pekingense]